MINNELDIRSYRAQLRSQGRVQIADILQPDAAEELHQCLRDEVPWQTAQRADAELQPGLVPSAPPGSPEDAALLAAVNARARDGFEFYFDRYRMIDARRDGTDPHLVLHVVVDFLNSPEFLEWARYLTGDAAIHMVSAIGVRYRAGHFLMPHSDRVGNEDRAYAYVFNLSHGWLPEWGGQLQFIDPQTHSVEETMIPRWNSLSLFRVPCMHQVTPVTPWAKSPRYSITGWFRRS